MRKTIVYITPKKNANLIMMYTMNLLLLTFFVALISFATPSRQKQNMGFNSIVGGFGLLPSGKSAFQDEVARSLSHGTAPLKPGELDVSRLQSLMANSASLQGTGIAQGDKGITITLRSDILFAGATDTLTPEGLKSLAVAAGIIKGMSNRIVITAHTDSRPFETPPYNSSWAFSAARALKVMQQLADDGVVLKNMSCYGMGPERPITTNRNEAGRRLNSRVEITMVGAVSSESRSKVNRLAQPNEPRIKTFQYKGFEFQLEDQ